MSGMSRAKRSPKQELQAVDERLAAAGLARRGAPGKRSPRGVDGAVSRESKGKRRPARMGRVEVVRVSEWEPLEWLWHGFSTRTGGETAAYGGGKQPGRDLNLGFTASDPEETVIANRRRFLEAVAGLGSVRNQSSLERKMAGSPGLPGLATLKPPSSGYRTPSVLRCTRKP